MAGLIHAHVDADTGWAVPDSKGFSWANLTTWSAWEHWDANPYTSIEYNHELDAGVITQCVPTVSMSADADLTVTESHSTDYQSWSPDAPIGSAFVARYVRIKVIAIGSYPVLEDMTAALLVDKKEQTMTDLATASLSAPYRLGVGDLRLPVSGAFSLITGVSIAFVGTGPGYSWELIDKSTSPGPRVRLYNASGSPTDAVIDAIVKGA